jgi:hypothetical protein
MTNEPEHRAACLCGQLAITVNGQPDMTIACNCFKCQQRTGAPFGVGAYYRRDAVVAIDGNSKEFGRVAESGRGLTNHFCPDCGTTVYWNLEMRPDHLGISAGCFADPELAVPARTIWTENKHHWVTFPDDLPAFEKAVPES